MWFVNTGANSTRNKEKNIPTAIMTNSLYSAPSEDGSSRSCCAPARPPKALSSANVPELDYDCDSAFDTQSLRTPSLSEGNLSGSDAELNFSSGVLPFTRHQQPAQNAHLRLPHSEDFFALIGSWADGADPYGSNARLFLVFHQNQWIISLRMLRQAPANRLLVYAFQIPTRVSSEL